MTAPSTAQYLVIALDAGLNSERRLIFGEGLAINDGGANGDYSVSVASRVLSQTGANINTASVSTSLTLFSSILDPNILLSNNALRLTILADMTHRLGVATSIQCIVTLGATTLYNDDAFTLTEAASVSSAVYMKLDLCSENATNAQVLGGNLYISSTTRPATGIGSFDTIEQYATTPILGTATENATTSLTFAVVIRIATPAATLFIRRYAVLERV